MQEEELPAAAPSRQASGPPRRRLLLMAAWPAKPAPAICGRAAKAVAGHDRMPTAARTLLIGFTKTIKRRAQPNVKLVRVLLAGAPAASPPPSVQPRLA